MKDKRYSINREFCGYSTRRYVVRFCGEWLGQTDGLAAAKAIVSIHEVNERPSALNQLIMTTNKVMQVLALHSIEVYHGYAVEQYAYLNGTQGERFVHISSFANGSVNLSDWLGY